MVAPEMTSTTSRWRTRWSGQTEEFSGDFRQQSRPMQRRSSVKPSFYVCSTFGNSHDVLYAEREIVSVRYSELRHRVRLLEFLCMAGRLVLQQKYSKLCQSQKRESGRQKNTLFFICFFLLICSSLRAIFSDRLIQRPSFYINKLIQMFLLT